MEKHNHSENEHNCCCHAIHKLTEAIEALHHHQCCATEENKNCCKESLELVIKALEVEVACLKTCCVVK